MKTKSYSVDMLNGPLAKKLIAFALPLAATSILQQLFNSADTAVVGRFVNRQAQAAVGANGYIINLLVLTFVGISVGSNVVISNLIARNESKKIHDAVHTSIALALLIGLGLIVLGEGLAVPMLGLISTPSNIMDDAVLYLRIFLIGVPFEMVYNFGSAVLRSQGDSKRPLYSLMLSGVINVVLNLFFVVVCGLSVIGVGLATVISNGITAGLVIYFLWKEESPFTFRFHELGIDRRLLKKIIVIGLPAGLQGMLFSISNVCIQSAINSFGDAAVAGASIGQYFDLYTYFFSAGFASAAVTFTSQNHAAGHEDRCRRIFWLCNLFGLISCFLVGVALVGFRGFFLGLYSTDKAVLWFATVNLFHRTIFEFFEVPFDVAGSSLRGHGHSLTPTLIIVIGTCAFRLACVFFIFPLSHKFEMLMDVYPISWLLTDVIMLIAYFYMCRRIDKRMRKL
ncbi:MAG: MATE family efflux transporter [Lachnospiraceae bacterium]|nr:MATE family efflux transporter [Lachnospiraceae bacterium]